MYVVYCEFVKGIVNKQQTVAHTSKSLCFFNTNECIYHTKKLHIQVFEYETDKQTNEDMIQNNDFI